MQLVERSFVITRNAKCNKLFKKKVIALKCARYCTLERVGQGRIGEGRGKKRKAKKENKEKKTRKSEHEFDART